MVRSIMMRVSENPILLLCVFALLPNAEHTFAQSETSGPLDLFPKYQVRSTFTGRPSPPILSSHDAHEFRTRIREGVAKGVVFAGHYEVAVWGCGSGCLSFAVIDAFTGRVTFFPATVSQNREVGERLTYKRNSEAIHIIGSLNEEDSADRWYVWDGNSFNLISKRPAILVDDNGHPLKP
ncbi:hypothetical protein [Granulicella paludicola]|uniref:hypothetical protein n=1 Tax=Granulicella paludicola TaxID=474951 RepID=UPI0021DF592D|nr:hypothetical protein [Granulicella paludicola]